MLILNLARVQTGTIEKIRERLLFYARRVYSCGRTAVDSCRASSRFFQSIKHILLCLYGVMTVGLDGGRVGVPSELRDCQWIEMTSNTLNGCFST